MCAEPLPRFRLEKYYVQRTEYFVIVDNNTGKPIPNLPGVMDKRSYEPLLDLLNGLNRKE